MAETAVHALGGAGGEQAHKKGETWVATREKGGKPVECLMGLCGKCGQPRTLQRVIRFSDHGIREWRALVEREYGWVHLLAFAFPSPIWVGVLAMGVLVLWPVVAGASPKATLLALAVVLFLIAAAVALLFVGRLDARRSKEVEEDKRRILAAHGYEISPDAVGTREQGWKEYVILPAA